MDLHRCFPLVVEDDEDFTFLLTSAFLKAGLPARNLRCYPDGERALGELFTAGALRPSALFLDVDLPGMCGLSVLERVRSWGPLSGVPAFVLSGREDPWSLARATALGATAYFKKPFGFSELWKLVRGILESLEGVPEYPDRIPFGSDAGTKL